MDDLYRDNILDHYKNPRNSGHLDSPTVTAEGVNPLCGDELQVELQIEDGMVTDLRFNGKPVAEVRELGSEDVLDELGIPLTPIRLKCALLSVQLLKVALGDAPPEDPDLTWNSG
jgi:nitrogen fixation NifU-like protein